MEDGMLAKFSQNKLLLKLLLLTKNAKLVHFSRGGNIVFNDLMKVRKILSEQYNTFIQGSKVSDCKRKHL